ncbi:hypothetical protein ADUPG1_010425, partial [Aduncisulcus paluster]
MESEPIVKIDDVSSLASEELGEIDQPINFDAVSKCSSIYHFYLTHAIDPAFISIGFDSSGPKEKVLVLIRSVEDEDVSFVRFRETIPSSWWRKLFGVHPSFKEVITAIHPEFMEKVTAGIFGSMKNVSQHKHTEKIAERCWRWETENFNRVHHHKIGLLYQRPGQKTEIEMFGNQASDTSPLFAQFLSFIGHEVDIIGFAGYHGGLDVRRGHTGPKSIFYQNEEGHEVMFHVSTMLPHSRADDQQIKKKLHIGNDMVVIVFQEPHTELPASNFILSQFVQCIIVVEPVVEAIVEEEKEKEEEEEEEEEEKRIEVDKEDIPSDEKEEEEEGETVLKPIPKLIGYKLHVIAGEGIVKDKLTEPESTIFPPDEHFSSFMKDLIIHADINSW